MVGDEPPVTSDEVEHALEELNEEERVLREELEEVLNRRKLLSELLQSRHGRVAPFPPPPPAATTDIVVSRPRASPRVVPIGQEDAADIVVSRPRASPRVVPIGLPGLDVVVARPATTAVADAPTDVVIEQRSSATPRVSSRTDG